MIWVKYFIIFAIVLGIMVSGALVYRKSSVKRMNNLLFSIMILSLSLYIALDTQPMFLISFPKAHLVSPLLLLAIPILLSSFINKVQGNKVNSTKSLLLFSMPALLYLLISIPYFSLDNSALVETFLAGNAQGLYISKLLIVFVGASVLLVSLRTVHRNRKGQNPESRVEFFSLLGVFFLVYVTNCLIELGHLVGSTVNVPLESHHVQVYILLFLMMSITFFVMVKPEHFWNLGSETNGNFGISKTRMMPDLKNRCTVLLSRLDELEPHLDPELTLGSLAEKVSMKKSEVSQVINSGLGLTFFELINSRRLDSFKKMVESGESRKLSISGMAYHSGFNNRATFYKYFKASTGMTPSEYIRYQRDKVV